MADWPGTRGPEEGVIDRRRLLTAGGVTLASATVLAACGRSETARPAKGGRPGPSGAGSNASTASDATILRTLSSVELLLVGTYQKVVDLGLITDPDLDAAARELRGQHGQHAVAFQDATAKAGTAPFTRPNSVLNAQVIAPAVARLKTDNDVLMLALTLESVSSQTCQAAVGRFADRTYNTTAGSVLGAESRHQTLLSLLMATTAPPPNQTSGFQTVTNAVRFGVGL